MDRDNVWMSDISKLKIQILGPKSQRGTERCFATSDRRLGNQGGGEFRRKTNMSAPLREKVWDTNTEAPAHTRATLKLIVSGIECK